MLIGLNGKLQAGKDTTYLLIKELHPEAEKVSFAAKLKQFAAASIGTDVETLEHFKNKEYIRFPAIWDNSHSVKSFNIREYLQWVGTEGGRNTFGENFWVDMALPSDLDHSDKLLVVTDMRFPNEIDRVIELGGFTVRVNRFTSTGHGLHASEQDIPNEYIDYELDNTGTIEELKPKIKLMLKEFEDSYAYSS